MKKIKKIKYIFLILVLAFLSCSKEVIVEVEDNESKLVLSAHFGNNEELKVYLSASSPLYEYHTNELQNIFGANIEISENNQNWITLSENSIDKFYYINDINYKISSGKTYYIKASAGGFESVKGSSNVPYYNDNVKVSISKLEIDESGDNPNYVFIKIDDVAGQKNYYGIKAYHENENVNYELSLEDNAWVFSDNLGDGSEYIFKFIDYNLLISGDKIKVKIYQTNQEFYNFHYSFNNYQTGNPFAEPTIVYTNIENGLGICSGYSSKEYYFTIP